MKNDIDHFFLSNLVGMQLSHSWRGHGSAIFLEFGSLQPRFKRDGSSAEPEGEMSLMIQWSWRIEGRRSILCGSWSDERVWPRAFSLADKCFVEDAMLFGNLPEIVITLSNGVRILSFMTAEGDPAWTLFDRREEKSRWMHVHLGKLRIETA